MEKHAGDGRVEGFGEGVDDIDASKIGDGRWEMGGRKLGYARGGMDRWRPHAREQGSRGAGMIHSSDDF